MSGISVLIIIASFLGGLSFLLIKMNGFFPRAALILLVILLFNGDDWYNMHTLETFCAKEAGPRIYEHRASDGGVIVSSPENMAIYLRDTPISYVEAELKEQGGIGSVPRIMRVDRLSNGGVSEPYAADTPEAKYRIISNEVNTHEWISAKEQIVEIESGTILGEFKGLFYYGGWFPSVITGRGAVVAACGPGGAVVLNKDWVRDMPPEYATATSRARSIIAKIFTNN
jgi:hypothetical protein